MSLYLIFATPHCTTDAASFKHVAWIPGAWVVCHCLYSFSTINCPCTSITKFTHELEIAGIWNAGSWRRRRRATVSKIDSRSLKRWLLSTKTNVTSLISQWAKCEQDMCVMLCQHACQKCHFWHACWHSIVCHSIRLWLSCIIPYIRASMLLTFMHSPLWPEKNFSQSPAFERLFGCLWSNVSQIDPYTCRTLGQLTQQHYGTSPSNRMQQRIKALLTALACAKSLFCRHTIILSICGRKRKSV